MRESTIVCEQSIYADFPWIFIKSKPGKREVAEVKRSDARPDLDTSLLVVADDTHRSFTKLDDAFLLQFLNRLDQP